MSPVANPGNNTFFNFKNNALNKTGSPRGRTPPAKIKAWRRLRFIAF
jgi:hypothetical protein